MKQKTISDLIIKITKLEEDVCCHDLQLKQLWNKTIGHFLEEAASWFAVSIILIGFVVLLCSGIHYLYDFIKRLFCC